MPKKTYKVFGIFLGVILIFLIGCVIGRLTNEQKINMRAVGASIITAIPKNGVITISANNLDKLELRALPTGTGITDANQELVGVANKISDNGGVQVWTIPITCPMLVTNLWMQGYQFVSGEQVDQATIRFNLPYLGASEISDNLCPINK
jgi:hypothetical protein